MRAGCLCPFGEYGPVGQAHRVWRLAGEHTDQISILHGVERVVLHAAVVQQTVTNKQVALVHRAAINGKRRYHHRLMGMKPFQQGIGHGANVAFVSGIKGGTVLKEQLESALLA